MPHDKNKRPLKAGDLINIPAIITSVREGEYCTLECKSLYLMPPYTPADGEAGVGHFSALNAAQVELRTPAELLAPLPSGNLNPEGVRGFMERQIIEDKNLRAQIDAIIQGLKGSPHRSAERTLAYRSPQLAAAWLGFDLKEINDAHPGAQPDPYPNSRDTSNTTIDKTADGLKL